MFKGIEIVYLEVSPDLFMKLKIFMVESEEKYIMNA